MIVSYRTNATAGTMMLQGVDLNVAFNRVARSLIEDGYLGEDYVKSVRLEGKVKIGSKKYAAISQAGLIIVENGPIIPDRVELRT